MRRIGIVAKPNKPEAEPVLRNLITWLRDRGCEVVPDQEAATICPEAGAGWPSRGTIMMRMSRGAETVMSSE